MVKYNEEYYDAILKMVWSLEKARWILYEIKIDSETGKIIKGIIYLLSKIQAVEGGIRNIDVDFISTEMLNAGFSSYLVTEVIRRLFGENINH